MVFGFSYFFPISTYLADFVCGFAVLEEFFFGSAVSSIPQCPPPYAHIEDHIGVNESILTVMKQICTQMNVYFL